MAPVILLKNFGYLMLFNLLLTIKYLFIFNFILFCHVMPIKANGNLLITFMFLGLLRTSLIMENEILLGIKSFVLFFLLVIFLSFYTSSIMFIY